MNSEESNKMSTNTGIKEPKPDASPGDKSGGTTMQNAALREEIAAKVLMGRISGILN